MKHSKSCWSDMKPKPDEVHIRKRERLHEMFTTGSFPEIFPTWMMDVPDGYQFWRELYYMYQIKKMLGDGHVG